MTVETLVAHILAMKQHDTDYARAALIEYDKLLPWINLKAAVREALK